MRRLQILLTINFVVSVSFVVVFFAFGLATPETSFGIKHYESCAHATFVRLQIFKATSAYDRAARTRSSIFME
jgi:hypothetical protein